ncbi:O-antigen ligase family protein [Mesobacillus foraminis]|uniref:O-antigen ligase family protein n=1 Tax=Mesobacillus foraminis TaxID=279826 RepID=UPI00399F8FE3
MKHFLLAIGLVTVFLSGSLYTTTSLKWTQLPLLIIGMTIIWLLILFKSNSFDKTLVKIISFTFVISITLYISVFKNPSLGLFISAFGLTAAVITLLLVSASTIFNNSQFYKYIIMGTMLSHVPIIIYSFIVQPFSIQPFKGIFYSSNGFGNMAATFFSAILSAFFIEYNKRKNRLLYLNLLIILIFLVIISGSRTSLFAIIGSTFTCITLLTLKEIKNKKNIYRKVRGFINKGFALLVLFLVMFSIPYFRNTFNERIIKKFTMKSDNQLDGRGEVWRATIENTTLFGNGRDHFEELGLGHGAHNTFISLLGQFGFVPTLLFILLIIYILIIASKRFLKNSDSYSILIISTGTCFVLLSLGEGMLMKYTMLLFFVSVGVISENGKKSLFHN